MRSNEIKRDETRHIRRKFPSLSFMSSPDDNGPWASLLSDGLTVWIHGEDHEWIFGVSSFEQIGRAWLIERYDLVDYALEHEKSWGRESPRSVAMPLQSRCDAISDFALSLSLWFLKFCLQCNPDCMRLIVHFSL